MVLLECHASQRSAKFSGKVIAWSSRSLEQSQWMQRLNNNPIAELRTHKIKTFTGCVDTSLPHNLNGIFFFFEYRQCVACRIYCVNTNTKRTDNPTLLQFLYLKNIVKKADACFMT